MSVQSSVLNNIFTVLNAYFPNLLIIIWNILCTGYSWLNNRNYYPHKIVRSTPHKFYSLNFIFWTVVRRMKFTENFGAWDFMFSRHDTEWQNLRILNSKKKNKTVIWYLLNVQYPAHAQMMTTNSLKKKKMFPANTHYKVKSMLS